MVNHAYRATNVATYPHIYNGNSTQTGKYTILLNVGYAFKESNRRGGQTQKFQVEQLETTIYAHFIYTLYSSKHNIIYNANVFKVYSNFEYTSREVFHSNNVCITAVGQ